MQNNFGSGKLALLAARRDVVVIGTDPDEFWEGSEAFVATMSPAWSRSAPSNPSAMSTTPVA